jgi:hypothetical protein
VTGQRRRSVCSHAYGAPMLAWSMILKNGNRFSGKIMLNRNARP